jgi:hypothetical protein
MRTSKILPEPSAKAKVFLPILLGISILVVTGYCTLRVYAHASEKALSMSPSVPLSIWLLDSVRTNAPYDFSITQSSLSLKIDALDTTGQVAIYSTGVSKLSLSDYSIVDVSVTGTSNAKIILIFWMDDGNTFDVILWGSPYELNSVSFDLSPYVGRTLTGLVYMGLMSSDGGPAQISLTGISFQT